MLDFSGKDEKSKEICLHYAKQFKNADLIPILECSKPVSTEAQAKSLSEFFWKMLEASADDRDNGIGVLGETDTQYWMERSMNIISGYLYTIGFEDVWEKISNDA